MYLLTINTSKIKMAIAIFILYIIFQYIPFIASVPFPSLHVSYVTSSYLRIGLSRRILISRRILTLLHSETWHDVIKLFMLNLSMEYVLVINFKMPTIVGILKFMTRQMTFFCCSEQEHSLV